MPKTQATLQRVRSSKPSRINDLVGTSPAIAHLKTEAHRIAVWSDHPILITGPIGSGKSHLARHIHALSARRDHPLEILNCGAISNLENLVFGHRRGAFTGAERDLRGCLREADGGTLVLDDFERLDPAHQDLFHRVVVDGTFRPIGAEEVYTVDARFIATTNADLDKEVENDRLKPDFLSRLDYFHLRMPALHERLGDIPVLCQSLLDRALRRHKAKGLSDPDREVYFAEACWAAIKSRRFYDNVRGLDKLIVRLLAYIQERDEIRPSDIDAVSPIIRREKTPWFDQPRSLQTVREAAEREYILRVCRHTNFNMRAAARTLEVSPKCLYSKLKRYGITRP